MKPTELDLQYIELIRERLKPARFEHSMNVAKCAVELAKKYGADEKKAYTAGILHDIMKNTVPEEQLKWIEKSGVTLTKAEQGNFKLWHAMAGEAYMKLKLGIDDEDLLNAVRYHTTARADMTVLEKVIYIADYISEERDYDGVDEMRALAEKSLEDAMFMGLQFSITELAENGFVIHPDSVNAYNEIVLGNVKKV